MICVDSNDAADNVSKLSDFIKNKNNFDNQQFHLG